MDRLVSTRTRRTPNGASKIFGVGFDDEAFITEVPEGQAVQLTVWGHDSYGSLYDVVVDMSLIPQAKEGDIAELLTRVGPKNQRRTLYFIVRPKPSTSNAQISVSTDVLAALEIPSRSVVSVALKSRLTSQIDQVELHFKGVHLTRADLYRISKALTGECLRVGQRVNRLKGLVRLTVDSIHRNGKRKYSGYVGPHTRLVYRSDSARLILMIQMSSEMWSFDETGDVAFSKLVDSFIPASLRQLSGQGDQHSVSIIFFTSVSAINRRSRLKAGELDPNAESYYRVVIEEVPVSRWTDILQTLRSEFASFSKEVLMNEDGELTGEFLPSSKGNVLEALSLATTFASKKFSDRDLYRTNLQTTVITPSPGMFDVNENEMYKVSKAILNVEMGVELVCLSRPPLHITPMFRARDRYGHIHHYIPTWMNVSFWNTPQRYVKQWLPRARIYDIQMMGVMENEIKAISIRHLAPGPYTSRFMKNYDVNVFKSAEMIDDERKVEKAASTSASASALLRPVDNIKPTRAVSGSTQAIAQVEPLAVVGNQPMIGEAFAVTSLLQTARTSLGALLKSSGAGGGAQHQSAVQSLRSRASTSFSRSSDFHAIDDRGSQISLTSPKTTRSTNGTQMFSPPDSLSPAVQIPVVATQSSAQNRSSPLGSSPYGRVPSMPLPIPNSKGDGSRAIAPKLPKVRLSPSLQLGSSPTLRLNQQRGIRRSVAVPLVGAKAAELMGPGASDPMDFTFKNPHRDMWRILRNPSVIDMPSRIQAYGKWAYVFPPGIKRRIISWDSLKSPASLPLTTEYFAKPQEWLKEFKVQFYDLAVGLNHESYTAGQLLDEMVALRLQMGYQISVGDSVLNAESKIPRGDPLLVAQVIPKNNYVGLRIYMLRESVVHRLMIEQDGLINVQIYTWVDPDRYLLQPSHQPKTKMNIKSRYDTTYRPLDGAIYDPTSQYDINWNQLDQQIAGLDDSSSSNSPYSIAVRFVLVPAPELIKDTLPPTHEKLSIEELRVEGIGKVVSTILKNRYLADGAKPKPQSAPGILFYTGDLSKTLSQLYGDGLEDQGGGTIFQADRLNKNISFEDLASELFGVYGPRLSDRRWHWKTYSRVFIGLDLVNWFVESFTDIGTADEAVEYGNQLMDKGFLLHVDGRHRFLSGHFFYQVAKAYIPEQPKSQAAPNRWFRGGVASDPRPPEPKKAKDGKARKHKIHITRVVTIDVDPKKVSDRKELINIHLDRVHNPDDAFNMHVEWLNTTHRLVDEFFTGINRLASSYGLRLVQIPVSGVPMAVKTSPFRGSGKVELAIDPSHFQPELTEPILMSQPFYFHHYLLRKLGFVYNATETPVTHADLQVEYSWKGDSSGVRHYVHSSGAILVDVLTDGTFFASSNAVHLSRATSSTEKNFSVVNDYEIFDRLRLLCDNKEVLAKIFAEAVSEYESARTGGSASPIFAPSGYTSPQLSELDKI